ncbi:hypothetical protein H5T53_07790 [Candidatus Bipolaricaulota bacterium]|nr:hypothetical protein [Candidatus Bipolaricaulota bacterium]
MAVALVGGLVLAGVAPAVVSAEPTVPFGPVVHLMCMSAAVPDLDRNTVSTALTGFMDGLLEYLRGQGVPEEGLARIAGGLIRALEGFRAGVVDAAVFGEDVARLAQELAELAMEGGVRGLPAALLARIGIATWAVEKLMQARELTGPEVAALAREIAGRASRPGPGFAAPAGDDAPGGLPSFVGSVPGRDRNEDQAGGPPAFAGPPVGVPGGPPGFAGPPGQGGEEDEEGKPSGRKR